MDEASARLVLSSAKTPEKIYEYEKNAEDLLVSFEKALMEERFDEASEIRIRRNRLLEDVKKLKGSFERSKKRKKMILKKKNRMMKSMKSSNIWLTIV